MTSSPNYSLFLISYGMALAVVALHSLVDVEEGKWSIRSFTSQLINITLQSANLKAANEDSGVESYQQVPVFFEGEEQDCQVLRFRST